MKNNNILKMIDSSCKHISGCVIKLPSHISYLTDLFFPYPDFSPLSVALITVPEKDESVLIVPIEWFDIVKDLKWEKRIVTYNINEGSPDTAFCNLICKCLSDLQVDTNNLAIDSPSWTVNEIKHISSKIKDFKWIDCDEILWRERMIKNEQEIDLLHKSARIADRGIIGALNHVEGTTGSSYYTLSEFLERVRVHAIEFGSYGIGHMNISHGAEGKALITPIRDFSFCLR